MPCTAAAVVLVRTCLHHDPWWFFETRALWMGSWMGLYGISVHH
jgi:hypothetical protein